MKIPPSFNQAYIDIYPVLEQLEFVVKPRAEDIAQKYNGAYSGRIKEPESILIKAEKQGVANPFVELADLFACTITVPNILVIEDVRQDVEEVFQLVTARQRAVKPEEFAYNDLNLTLKVKSEFWNRNEAYMNLLFELQVKTLLQQAWSQAGHDVIYKARKKTWGVTRIASQLRALLEMADSMLANLEHAANSLQGTVHYPGYETTNQLVGVLEKTWDSQRLPTNLYSIAQIIAVYLSLSGLAIDELETLLREEQYSQYINAHSLSPSQAIFIILFHEKWGDMGPRLKNRKILVTVEMLDLCPRLTLIPPEYRMKFQ